MTHQEISDGNGLIKDFMGSTIKIEQDDVKDIPLAFLKLPDLKFNMAWKWLMPVVMKIEDDLGYSVRIEKNSCVITADDATYEVEAETKLEAVWKAVVECLGAE